MFPQNILRVVLRAHAGSGEAEGIQTLQGKFCLTCARNVSIKRETLGNIRLVCLYLLVSLLKAKTRLIPEVVRAPGKAHFYR